MICCVASAVESSVDALRFMATRIRKQLEGRGMSGRQQVIEQTMAKFVDLGLNAMSGLRRQLVLQTLADICGVGSNDLDRLARTMRARPTASSADQSPQSDRSFDRAFEASSIPQSAFITEVPPLGGRQRARADAQGRLPEDMARHGITRHDMARHGTTRLAMTTRHDMARHDMTWHDTT